MIGDALHHYPDCLRMRVANAFSQRLFSTLTLVDALLLQLGRAAQMVDRFEA